MPVYIRAESLRDEPQCPSFFDAVVIGSGLGGLKVGALISHAGARVLVLERNASFGGAATTYHRGPLTIDAWLHETTPPSALGDPKLELFELLGLDDDVELVPVPNLHEICWKGLGTPFKLRHGFDQIKAALMQAGGHYIRGGSQRLPDRLVAEIRKGR